MPDGQLSTPSHPTSRTEDDRFDRLRLIRSRRVGAVTFHRLLAEHGSARAALAALPAIARAAGVEEYERVFPPAVRVCLVFVLSCPTVTVMAGLLSGCLSGLRQMPNPGRLRKGIMLDDLHCMQLYAETPEGISDPFAERLRDVRTARPRLGPRRFALRGPDTRKTLIGRRGVGCL